MLLSKSVLSTLSNQSWALDFPFSSFTFLSIRGLPLNHTSACSDMTVLFSVSRLASPIIFTVLPPSTTTWEPPWVHSFSHEDVIVYLQNGIRKPAPQKAWTSGMNPITQRSTTPAQQNGVGSQARAVSLKSTSNQETGTYDRHSNDRLLFILGNFMVSRRNRGLMTQWLTAAGAFCFHHSKKWGCFLWNILWCNIRKPRACLSPQNGATSQRQERSEWGERQYR